MSEIDTREKMLSNDPCLGCDIIEKRNLFLEQIHPKSTVSKEPSAPSLFRQTLEQYQQSHLKYKHLIETAPDAIFVVDRKTGIILEANNKAAELLGIPVDQIIGMHQTKLHPPEESQKYQAFFQKSLHLKIAPLTEETYVRNKDGHDIPVRISSSVIEIDNTQIILGVFCDISKEKKMLLKLINSEARFKQLAAASFEGIIIHDLDNHIIDVNPQLLDMYGYTSEELKKLPMMEMVAPQCRDTVKEKISSGYFKIYQTYGMKKDGTIFPVMVHCREAVQDKKPIRIVSLYDLTEQEELKEKLSESEKKYKELYRHARAALFRTRISDGRLLDCSRAASRLFGYANEAEYINNFSVTESYMDPQQRQSFIEALKKNKRVHGFQLELKHKDGSPIWVEMTAEIFPEQDFIEGAMQDITATKVLTKSEKDILEQLMQGMSNKEIAFETDRSVRTIEDHRANIMKKLAVDNIVELTQKALKLPIYYP
ncbi:MAG: PAS domain-containing protein [Planctomycetota bacterium]|jgi:PAS domain S-box-containing protein